MDREEIRTEVKKLIGKVTGLVPDEIPDAASFSDDLELDSLAMIEIAVDVAYAYKLQMTEEEMAGLRTLDEAVEMVIAKQSEAAQG